MVLLVENNIVFSSGERRDYAEVNLETGAVEHGVFFADIVGKPGLKVFVDVEGAVEEGASGHAGAVFPGGGDGRLDNLRMVGEPHITVGAEHEHLLAVHQHLGVLLARYGPEIRVYTRCLRLLGRVILRQFLL